MDFPSFYCLTWDSFRPGVRPQLVRTRRSPTWPWAFAPVRSRRARPADPIATSLERKWRCSKHGGIFGDTFWIYLDIWLVVSNMFFQYIGNVIIPTDELHHFSEGFCEKPPTSHEKMMLPDLDPQVLPAMSDSHVFRWCHRQAGDKKGEVSALHTAGRPGEVLGSLGASKESDSWWTSHESDWGLS